MYINNVNFNNENSSFKRLKQPIRYVSRFDPKTNLADAKAVLYFKKSPAFSKFFEKFDGYVKFGRYSFTRGGQATKGQAYLDVFYKEKTGKDENILKNLLNKLSSLIFNNEEYSVFQLSVIGDLEDLSKNLGTIIRMSSYEGLMEKVNAKKLVIDEKREKMQKEALKRINQEIENCKI